MLRTPPHILVTTPESLYLLLTAERSREMLRTARTVIVDEIHAVIGTRRARTSRCRSSVCEQVAGQPLLRIGSVGDAETDRRSRAVSRWIRPSARLGRQPAKRNPAFEIRRSDCRRGPSPRRWISDSKFPARRSKRSCRTRSGRSIYNRLAALDRAASDDADLREHAADGRARRASPERSSRRRGGHGASRQPVEGQAARRRVAAQGGGS